MKKTISLFLCVAIFVSSMFIPTTFAQSTQNEIALLNNLGFSMLNPDSDDTVLKRDAFAYLMYGLLTGGNFSSVSMDEKSVFKDVANKNKYLPYINALYKTGYIKGIGDGKYAPDASVTLNQLTNVMVKILGYPLENLSESQISNVAVRSGLYNNVIVGENDEITLSIASKIIVNALDAKMYFDEQFLDVDVEDNTLLNVNFGLYTVEGTFFAGKALDKSDDYVKVADVIYKAEYNPLYNTINGYLVKAYVSISDDKVMFVDYNFYANEFYFIEARDVISSSTTTLKFYDKSDKEKSVKISGLKEVYNGKLTDFNHNDFIFNNGSIVLVSDGSTYTTAVINKFDTMVVGAVNNNTVYDYYDSTFNHTFEDTTNFVLNGEELSIKSLQKGDVLSIAYSKDMTLCTVYVSREKITGEVSGMEDDNFIINRKPVYRSNYFAQYVKDPELGSYVSISIDHLGRAVAILDEDDESAKYAYFIDAQIDDNTGKEYIEFLNYDGVIMSLNIAQKVKVNGKIVKGVNLASDSDDLVKALKTMVSVDADGVKKESLKKDYVCQVIKYKANQDGEVNYIDTAIKGTYEDENSLDLSYSFKELKYKSGPAQFEFSYGVKKDAICFFVPEEKLNTFDAQGKVDTAKRDSVDKEEDFVVGTSYFGNDARYTGMIYDITEGGFAKSMVIDGAARTDNVDRNGHLLIIEKVTKTKNVKGDETYKIKGYLKGAAVSYTVAEPEKFLKDKNDLLSVPKSGDVLQISTNYNGEIVSFVCCYDTMGKVTPPWSDLCEWKVGYAYSKDDDGFIMTEKLGDLEEKYIVSSYSKQNVYVYDTQEEKVSIGNLSDIVTYLEAGDIASKVYVRTRYFQPQDFVIYK